MDQPTLEVHLNQHFEGRADREIEVNSILRWARTERQLYADRVDPDTGAPQSVADAWLADLRATGLELRRQMEAANARAAANPEVGLSLFAGVLAKIKQRARSGPGQGQG